MKVNIYYGGRGLMDDPTLFVLNKMKEVLEELRVTVETFYLYDLKNNITTLPQTLKEADGVILGSTVEWYGIGGYMYQFLDSCWLYGDKEVISQIYMCPIVMSTTYGEREGKLNLATAWEILGGRPCSGICGYIADTSMLEESEDYLRIIEKKAENLYRTINQKLPCLPASNQAVKQKVAITKNINFTPQESEQLSQFVSDDTYVQRQKADIQELASMFRDMMGSSEREDANEFVKEIQDDADGHVGVAREVAVDLQRVTVYARQTLEARVERGIVEHAVDEVERYVVRDDGFLDESYDDEAHPEAEHAARDRHGFADLRYEIAGAHDGTRH